MAGGTKAAGQTGEAGETPVPIPISAFPSFLYEEILILQ